MIIFFVIFFILAATANHIMPSNTTNDAGDVFIRHDHADVNRNEVVVRERPVVTTLNAEVTTEAQSPPPIQPTPPAIVTDGEMVFIPNHRADDDGFLDPGRPLGDNGWGEEKLTLDDLVSGRFIETTEAPYVGEVLFITGKNHEDPEESTEEPLRSYQRHGDAPPARRSGTTAPPKKKVNCEKLDCQKNVGSLCGRKKENGMWKYRLFLNECYFDKVNCGFKFAYNKYSIVPVEKCKNIGGHYSERPFVYVPRPPPDAVSAAPAEVAMRRSFLSRRATNMDTNGQFCSHPCPTSCPRDYDPECGISATGQKRIFLNHCQLDLNSCSFRVVWHRRPLPECAGHEAVELRQNRSFITWMQKIGIIDARGRFTKEE